MTKKSWLDLSEVINALRLAPRLILLAFATFVVWYVGTVTVWYLDLPAIERTIEASTFVGATNATMTAFFLSYYKAYMTGPKGGSGE